MPVQRTTTDEDTLAALRLPLKKQIQDAPELAADAARWLTAGPTGGNAVIASSRRFVAIGGNVSSSVIITGGLQSSEKIEHDRLDISEIK